MEINYITTNSHKFAVAKHFFASNNVGSVNLKQSSLETPEIQADSVEEVARQSAIWAGEKLGQAVVVGDAGLAISALNDFPGPYMKYANQTLTASDLLRMMADKPDRAATFNDCLAYYDPTSQEAKVFLSRTNGAIATQASTNPGSSIDKLFIPQGWDIPLADIPDEERVKVWNDERWSQLVEFLQAIATE